MQTFYGVVLFICSTVQLILRLRYCRTWLSPPRYNHVYQLPLILTELFQHNLINVSYPTACYLYQVMMTLHFLNDVANDSESTQK